MNKGQLAVVHIAKQQVGMTQDEYDLLLSSVGVKSSKELNRKGFSIVMNHFEQLGFRTKSTKRRKTKNLPDGKAATMSKIEAILMEMGADWGYVDAIALKRFHVESVQWLEYEDLRKILQMLIFHQKRTQARGKGRKHA